MKFYWLLFKIKVSKENENLYHVYRRFFPGKLELAAIVIVNPKNSISINSILYISAEESIYLMNHFRKIANLSEKSLLTDVTS